MEYTYIIFTIGVITIIYASLSTLRIDSLQFSFSCSCISFRCIQ
jgi:hypothetical protein